MTCCGYRIQPLVLFAGLGGGAVTARKSRGAVFIDKPSPQALPEAKRLLRHGHGTVARLGYGSSHSDDLGAGMGRENWKLIRDGIADEIARGIWAPGAQLPPEAELCRNFAAGRHSVRRAVQMLAIEGTLAVVQGRGTFVENAPLVHYAIGRRTRFRQNLLAQGLQPVGEQLAAATLPASAHVAAALGLAEAAPVHRLLRRGLADAAPISLGLSFHPAVRFPDLLKRRAEGVSITVVYREAGIADYFRKHTTIFARRPEPEEARLLRQHPDQPVLVLTKTDVTASGEAIGYSEAVWAAGRVLFSLDCPGMEIPDA